MKNRKIIAKCQASQYYCLQPRGPNQPLMNQFQTMKSLIQAQEILSIALLNALSSVNLAWNFSTSILSRKR